MPPEEKKLLEKLAGVGWGPIQTYFRLTPQDLADLRAGQELNFVAEAHSGARPLPARVAPRPLPPDLAHGVLQSMTPARGYRLRRMPGGGFVSTTHQADPTAIPLTDVPDTRA